MYHSRCVSRSVAFVSPCILYACLYCMCESNSVELQINLFVIILFEGVHFEIEIVGPKCFPFKWKQIGFWFQECLNFPNIYLVTNLHKIWTNVFFLTCQPWLIVASSDKHTHAHTRVHTHVRPQVHTHARKHAHAHTSTHARTWARLTKTV